MWISAGVTASQFREWKNVGRRVTGVCCGCGCGFGGRRTATFAGFCCAFAASGATSCWNGINVCMRQAFSRRPAVSTSKQVNGTNQTGAQIRAPLHCPDTM